MESEKKTESIKQEEIEPLEKSVPKIVEIWINRNTSEFGSGENLLYRKFVLQTSKKFLFAPTKFLETMLGTFPDNMKWYFNILYVFSMSGILGVSISLLIWSLNNFNTWINNPILDILFFEWFIPPFFPIIILFLNWKEDKKTGSSMLSKLIQTKLRIFHNLREIQIEMYYISRILEIREKHFLEDHKNLFRQLQAKSGYKKQTLENDINKHCDEEGLSREEAIVKIAWEKRLIEGIIV